MRTFFLFFLLLFLNEERKCLSGTSMTRPGLSVMFAAVCQVCLKSEHGLDARPGAQEQVAYRRKKFGDEDEKQSDGDLVCTCVSVCGRLRGHITNAS